jgi:hypothetical protein
MMPPILRRYEYSIVQVVDNLITLIATWEDGQFSASEVQLTRSEAHEIAAWLINAATDPFGFPGLGLTGERLLEILQTIRVREGACDGAA